MSRQPWLPILAIVAAICPARARGTEESAAQRFALPIGRIPGKDCYIMHYVDVEPGTNAVDFGGGRQTYDGHDGTDFGIADWKAMEAGVPITAAAAGVVLRVRDGVADKLVADQTDKTSVTNIEAGNGVIVDHGNGWETQYAHMRKGSVTVKPNTRVAKGDVLGLVGSSGLASFPHIHFTIRYNGKVVDPFVGIPGTTGRDVERHPLWEQPMEYVPTGLISAGFAPKPPTQSELWRGQFSETASALTNLPALVFWVHIFGICQGDNEQFTLTSPAGQKVIDSEKPATKSYRSWFRYVGKPNKPQEPLARGTWRGVYQLRRGDSVLIRLERMFLVE